MIEKWKLASLAAEEALEAIRYAHEMLVEALQAERDWQEITAAEIDMEKPT